jgi:hypothetical protein
MRHHHHHGFMGRLHWSWLPLLLYVLSILVADILLLQLWR